MSAINDELYVLINFMDISYWYTNPYNCCSREIGGDGAGGNAVLEDRRENTPVQEWLRKSQGNMR